MAASLPAEDICGQKPYFGGRYHVMLYSISQKRLLTVIEASLLGAMRTGAASGVATRYLARDDASVVGIIGTGKQARTQLQAMNAVRALRTVRVFGRDVGCVLKVPNPAPLTWTLPRHHKALANESVSSSPDSCSNQFHHAHWSVPASHSSTRSA